jgi:hypothetical protein
VKRCTTPPLPNSSAEIGKDVSPHPNLAYRATWLINGGPLQSFGASLGTLDCMDPRLSPQSRWKPGGLSRGPSDRGGKYPFESESFIICPPSLDDFSAPRSLSHIICAAQSRTRWKFQLGDYVACSHPAGAAISMAHITKEYAPFAPGELLV